MTRKTRSLSFLRPSSPLQNDQSPSSPASPLSPPLPTPPSSTSTAISAPIPIPPPLHLRTLLSPPLPPLFRVTVPKTPYPWTWKCHLCNSVYRLGVTRRCLEDGHYFCSLPSPPPSPVQDEMRGRERAEESSFSEDFESSAARLLAKERERKKKEKQRKKRRAQKGCRAEFDYTGWSKYNNWRREISSIKYREYGTISSNRRIGELRYWEESPVHGSEKVQKDCWYGCDFPSECLNWKIRERESMEKRERMRVLEEEWVRERARLQTLIEMGDEIENDDERGWDGDFEMFVYNPPTDFYDAGIHSVASVEEDPRISAEEREEDESMVEGKNLGPLGTDCDGLGEGSKLTEYTQCMRKSLDAAAEGEIPPPSPLKECSFGFEDVELRFNIWAGEKENKMGDLRIGRAV